MYPNYINDRKALGYGALYDSRCGIKLVLMTDSIVLLLKNHSSKIDRRKKRILAVVCLGLSQADKSVFENRVAVRKFIRKSFGKGKVIVISTALGIIIFFYGVENVDAMGLSPVPQAPIMRLENRIVSTKFVPSNVNLNIQKQDKISFIRPRELPICIYLMDDRFLSTTEVSSMIRKLRGGSWSTALIGNAVLLAVLYGVWILSGGAKGFVTPKQNPGWGLPNGLYEPPGLVRPTDCETQLYAGFPQQSLKTEASRNQPNPKDRWVLVESRPELVIRRGQAQFKTKDHGALTGLPYKIKKNGGTSTLRTEENVDIFMDSVEEIAEDSNSIWFEEGTYQGGTTREVESINIYNEEKNRIAIFKRSTGEFITVCEPTEDEANDIMKTGNFGGQLGWFSGQGKNLLPQVNSQQNVGNEMTPIDSFESNVMGMTPAPEFSPVDEVPNPGFTPLNSFERDVLGITPVDSSASDYQI